MTYRYLSDKDIEEGKRLLENFQLADNEGKKAILIYAETLKDMAILKREKQTA